MKRYIVTLCCLLMVAVAGAQTAADKPVKKYEGTLGIRKKDRPISKGWYVYAGGGYGIPFIKTNKFSPFKEIGNKDWYQSPTDLSVKPIFGTLGGGWCANIGWGHMFNEHIGIDVLHTIAWHPRGLDARINTTSVLGGGKTASYYAEEYSSIFGVYVSPHLVMHWDNNRRFGITGKAGLCLPIAGVPISEAKIIDQSGRLLETLTGLPVIPVTAIADFRAEYTARARTYLNPTVGVSTSIAFDLRLFRDVWAFAEIRVQAFTIKLKETKFEEFSLKTESPLLPLFEALTPLPLNITSVDEAPVYLKHFVYNEELTEESNTMRYTGPDGQIKQIDPDMPMDEPGYKFNASTMYFNAGIRFNFTEHWKKVREKRVQPRRDEKISKKTKI